MLLLTVKISDFGIYYISTSKSNSEFVSIWFKLRSLAGPGILMHFLFSNPYSSQPYHCPRPNPSEKKCKGKFQYKKLVEDHIKDYHKEDTEALLAEVKAESAFRNEARKKYSRMGKTWIVVEYKGIWFDDNDCQVIWLSEPWLVFHDSSHRVWAIRAFRLLTRFKIYLA